MYTYVLLSILFTMTQVFSQKGDRPLAPNTAIVITDGVSTYDPEKTIPYANDAKRDGIKIMAVGITNQVKLHKLSL